MAKDIPITCNSIAADKLYRLLYDQLSTPGIEQDEARRNR